MKNETCCSITLLSFTIPDDTKSKRRCLVVAVPGICSRPRAHHRQYVLLQKGPTMILADQMAEFNPPGVVGWLRSAGIQERGRALSVTVQRRAQTTTARNRIPNGYEFVITQIPPTFTRRAFGHWIFDSDVIAENGCGEIIHQAGLLVVLYFVDKYDCAIIRERSR